MQKKLATTLKSLSRLGTETSWKVSRDIRIVHDNNSLTWIIEKYYKGINSAQLSSTDNTGYKWSFAKKLDQHELDSVRDSVDTMTGGGRSSSQRRRTPAGPSRPPMTGYDQVGKS